MIKIVSFCLLVIISIMPTDQLFSQHCITMDGYQKSTLYLCENEGKYELRDNERTIVPANYDLVLPSLLAEFSFIVHGEKLGVFDNIKQKEIVFENEYDEVQLYPGKNGEYYIYFIKKDTYNAGSRLIYKLIREEDNSITYTEVEQVDLKVALQGFYQNGISRIDAKHYVHHFSNVNWDKQYGGEYGEESVQYLFQDLVQLSGIFSLADRDFVVDPTYAYIELPEVGNIENPMFTDYILVTRVLGSQSFDSNGETPVIIPINTYRYGLYSKNYKRLIDHQNRTPRYIVNGGFYVIDSEGDIVSMTAFNSNGEEICTLKDFPTGVDMATIVGNKIYVGIPGQTDVEVEMNVLTFKIYLLNGEYVASEKFRFEYTLDSPNIAMVAVTTSPTDYDLIYGIYDLENSKYLVLPEYHLIDKHYFDDDYSKCPSGIPCDYYYACQNDGDVVYYSSQFKPFVFD